ncbi:CGNR zinc finger domain-containing protein [Amycolatopsis endophytica]|uniref:Putative RNA-binding Zn ribbon-like protein n=1 Tax=Amycolatopsis endophytica TaxID=860233 RepID=A0A853BC92_9PSEU|nr:CGNR zinc finger domain-containing protein [Amycolatopsis endophytica]NYI91996.1 putative RNA-binding Zn ribbon-like protein [Amycolatopsis endophytica]
MHFNPYGGAGAQAAAGLANMPGASAADLVRMMRAAGMSLTRLSAAEAAGTREWGHRLREVFAEPDPDRRIDLVNALLAESACRPFISRHDGLPAHLHYAYEEDDRGRRVRAYTAGGLAHLLCEDGGRMGVCASADCDTVFVDTSRNGRRRFCSTRCATRVHVARHRARASGDGGEG